MKTSAKVTTLTFFGASALAAAAFAFGCTVTSGTVDDDGGTTSSSSGNPPPTPPSTDGGGGDSATATCEGNNQDKTQADFGAECQSCLEANCCSQLKNCFNQTPAADDAGTTPDDCNKYSKCVLFCENGDAGDVQQCEQECSAATTPAIENSYNDILVCGKASCSTQCGIK